MSLELPPDLEDRIKAQVESGQFETEEDVLREALDSLEKRQGGLRELRQMVREAEADVAAGLHFIHQQANAVGGQQRIVVEHDHPGRRAGPDPLNLRLEVTADGLIR